MSQAKVLPTHVLMPSIGCRKLWTFIQCRQVRGGYDKAPSGRPARMVLCQFSVSSDRLLRVRSPIMLERDVAAHDVVVLPLGGTLGKRELRLDDLLEHRVGRRVLLG